MRIENPPNSGLHVGPHACHSSIAAPRYSSTLPQMSDHYHRPREISCFDGFIYWIDCLLVNIWDCCCWLWRDCAEEPVPFKGLEDIGHYESSWELLKHSVGNDLENFLNSAYLTTFGSGISRLKMEMTRENQLQLLFVLLIYWEDRESTAPLPFSGLYITALLDTCTQMNLLKFDHPALCPVHYARTQHRMESLLRNRPDLIDRKDPDGNSPLHLKAHHLKEPRSNSITTIDEPENYTNELAESRVFRCILLHRPQLIHAENHLGQTPLHLVKTVYGAEWLLRQKDIKIDHMDRNGNTPLAHLMGQMQSYNHEQLAIVRLFIEKGANLFFQLNTTHSLTYDLKGPLEYAIYVQSEALLGLLWKKVPECFKNRYVKMGQKEVPTSLKFAHNLLAHKDFGANPDGEKLQNIIRTLKNYYKL